jgi:hypothetical protein
VKKITLKHDYSWLQKNVNCQNKIGTFLQFFHSVKPSLRDRLEYGQNSMTFLKII